MNEYRALGTVSIFSAATNVGLELDLADGVGNTVTLDTSVLAFYQIAAGSYRYPSLLTSAVLALRDWIHDAAIASGVLTVGATKCSPDAQIAPSNVANGALCTLSITGIPYTFVASGLPALIAGARLVQSASGIWTEIGLLSGVQTSHAATSLSSTTASWLGQFQARSIYSFDRGENDSGDAELSNYVTHHLASGIVRTYELTAHTVSRRLTLLDQDYDMCGPSVHLGLVASLNGDRDTITFAQPTSYTVPSIGTIGFSETLAEEGRYICIANRYVARIKTTTTNTLQLYEKIPVSITIPVLSQVTQISDAHALWYEAIRVGAFVIYGLDESTGLPLWNGATYAISNGEQVFSPERRDIGNPLYSFTYDLIRKDVIG